MKTGARWVGGAAALVSLVLSSFGASSAYAQNAVVVGEVPAGGTILDFDGQRVLFRLQGTIAIKDLATGSVTACGTTTQTYGHLTSVGAVWRGGEWRDGAYVARPDLASVTIRAAGDWLVWADDASTGSNLHQQNHATGVITDLVTDGMGFEPDVEASGKVAYVHYSVSSSRFTVVGAGASSTNGMAPVAAGTRAGYVAHSLAGGRVPIYLGGVALTKKASISSGYIDPPVRDRDYRSAPAGGWFAFTDVFATQQLTAWTVSPAGVVGRASSLTHETLRLTGVNDVGEITYVTSKHYLSRAGGDGAPTTEIEIPSGEARAIGSSWYVLGSPLVWRVERPGEADAGAPPVDAGGSDGGGDVDAGGSDDIDAGVDAGVSDDGDGGAHDGGAHPPMNDGGSGGPSSSSGSSGASDSNGSSDGDSVDADDPRPHACSLRALPSNDPLAAFATAVLTTLAVASFARRVRRRR